MTKYKIMLSTTQPVLNDYTEKPRIFPRVEQAKSYATLSGFKHFTIRETPLMRERGYGESFGGSGFLWLLGFVVALRVIIFVATIILRIFT